MRKIDYTNNICPICNKVFNDNDDIVVCPECGTPMHRDCYNELGECINTKLHGNYDFSQDKNNNKQDLIKCSVCSFENNGDSFYCQKCGSPLTENNNNSEFDSSKENNTGSTPFSNLPIDLTDPFGGIPRNEKLDENITVDEMASYVKQSTPYYMRVFHNINTFNKSKFNFGAAIFSGGFFLYRKMYLLGSILAFFEAAILLFTQYLSYFVYNSTEFQTIISKITNMSQGYGSFDKVLEVLSSITPTQLFMLYLPTILDFLLILIMVVVGFTANRIYFNHCKKQINKIKSKTTDNVLLKDKLKSKGGVNIAIGVSLLVCYLLISYLPGIILGF